MKLKTISADKIPPTFTSQVLGMAVGDALEIPIEKRWTALSIVRYYNMNKAAPNKERLYSTRKKNDTTVWLIRKK